MKKSHIITLITAVFLLQSCSTEDVNTLLDIKEKYQKIKPKYDVLKESYDGLKEKHALLEASYKLQKKKLDWYVTAGQRLYQ